MVTAAPGGAELARSELAWSVLAGIPDPEIPVVSIVEMGIVRSVTVRGDDVDLAITPTYSGCPAMHAIAFDIDRALHDAGFAAVRIATLREPAWTTDWMSAAAREKLRAYGIAPPVGSAGGRGALFGAAPDIACPRCGSHETERVSEFGSTACKALYRCRACLEPFDYFKCI